MEREELARVLGAPESVVRDEPEGRRCEGARPSAPPGEGLFSEAADRVARELGWTLRGEEPRRWPGFGEDWR